MNSFNFNRVGHLLKRRITLDISYWLIGFLSVGGFFLVISSTHYISSINFTGGGFLPIRDTVITFYVIGGLILTSNLFNEIHNRSEAFQYLTLPATNAEKLFASWITGSFIYTLAAATGIFLLSLLLEFMEALDTGMWNQMHLFNPISTNFLNTASGYIFYQSVFLFGAIYFRKNNFLKTLLAIVAFLFGLILLLGVFQLAIATGQTSFTFRWDIGHNWTTFLEFLIGIVIMTVFLSLSYLQLKKRQTA